MTPTAADLAAGLGLRHAGRGKWRGGCPVCGGSNRFQVSDGTQAPLLYCFGGCDFKAIVSELWARGLWPAAGRLEFSEAERRRWAAARRRAAAIAQLAGAWLCERLAELEAAKHAALDLDADHWDVETLSRAAQEHHRLSALDAAGVLMAWKAARRTDPDGTRALERIGLEWQAACERMAATLEGFVRKEAASDAA